MDQWKILWISNQFQGQVIISFTKHFTEVNRSRLKNNNLFDLTIFRKVAAKQNAKHLGKNIRTEIFLPPTPNHKFYCKYKYCNMGYYFANL